jgi:hypothetical protein
MTPFSGDIYVIASFFGGVGERLRYAKTEVESKGMKPLPIA